MGAWSFDAESIPEKNSIGAVKSKTLKLKAWKNFEKCLVVKGISNRAAELITSSRRSGTTANHRSAYKK